MRRLNLTRRSAAALLLLAACKQPKRVRGVPGEEEPGLKSVVHVADPDAVQQLAAGFHALENNAWRWTKGKFIVTLRTPYQSARDGAYLVLKFSVADSLIQRIPEVKLSVKVNGTPLPGESYTKSGEFVYRREVPASALQPDVVPVEFALEKYIEAGVMETRELGLIVAMIAFEARG